MADRSGICAFCKCSYHNPCPAGCGWANRGQTLCTECTDIAKAFTAAARKVAGRMFFPASTLRNRHPFFRGYVAATRDGRELDGPRLAPRRAGKKRGKPLPPKNPYATLADPVHHPNPRRRFWALGYEAGAAS